MRIQQARRTNPYPWTWEIPIATAMAALLTMIFALHIARAIAYLVHGSGLSFAPRSELFSAVPGLLAGHASAGLATGSGHVTRGELWFWITLTELALLVAIGLLARSGLRRWGPGRIQGMASPGEAEQRLGLSRLRRCAPVIRPDLYPRAGRYDRS